MARRATTREGSKRSKRDRRWRPPHCPHPDCAWHLVTDTSGWKFQRRGQRAIQRDPRHPNTRFLCCDCGRWFSRATFSCDYWQKIAGLSARAYRPINQSQSLRQASHELGVSPTTGQRLQRKLAAQAVLWHQRHEQQLLGRLEEPLDLDGLRQLVQSVHQMAEINTLYTAHSGFCLASSAFAIRQGVGKDPLRLERRELSEARWGKPDPAARIKAVGALLARIEPLMRRGIVLELRTDLEPDYLEPMRALAQRRPVRHVVVSSRARRDENNPLWMANHKHRLQRHAAANLRRETLAQSKRLYGLQDRMELQRLWLNVTKGVSERTATQRRTTPAMKLGLEQRVLTGRDLFRERLFPRRCGLTEDRQKFYLGRVTGWPNEVPPQRIPKFVA